MMASILWNWVESSTNTVDPPYYVLQVWCCSCIWLWSYSRQR